MDNRSASGVGSVPVSPESSPRFVSLGDGSEILQVALAPGDAVTAGEGAFCYRGLGLRSEVQPRSEVGALGRAFAWMGLKNDRVVKWTNSGSSPTYIGFAAPSPGKVIPVNLAQAGHILAKPQSFLCSVISNQLSMKKLKLTPEGPIHQHHIHMRKISGSGMCYIQAGGGAVQKALGRSESMMVEMGCVAAVSETCKIVAAEQTGLMRTPPYPQGFAVKITGPGTVFIQSTHAGRLARDRMSQRPGAGGSDVMKAAAFTIGILVLLFAIFDGEY